MQIFGCKRACIYIYIYIYIYTLYKYFGVIVNLYHVYDDTFQMLNEDNFSSDYIYIHI